MKKLLKWIPLAVILLGAVCAVLRAVLFAAADDRGLLPVHHPAGIALTVLSVLTLAILGIYLWKGQKKEFRILLSVPVQAVGCLAGAAGMLIWVFSAPEAGRLMLIFKLTGAICLLLLAYYRFSAKKAPLILPAVITVSLMVLCFGQYRGWGQHTQLQEYLFPALSALLLAGYSLEFCYMELPERNCKKTFLLNQAALFCTLACLNTENWPYYLGMSLWLVSGLFVAPCKMVLPQTVLRCMDKLEKAGHTVYAVGGCVRDAMLGLTPHDYDLCTDATPEEICSVFQNYELVRNGEKHGTVGVVLEHKLYEITTYRTEGNYADHRHPDQVNFVKDIKEDLARRDFTVNAMAYHPKTGYVDAFGGQQDLFQGVIRAVGNPETRFQEDALRILRGVRFACRFRFAIEHKTNKAMVKMAPLLEEIAQERVSDEMTQILCHMRPGDLVRFRPVILQVIPELKDSVGFEQHSPHHSYDVFTHTDYVLAASAPNPAVRWAALLHDVGKPQVFTQDEKGKGHFYGHAEVSAELAENVLRRMKLSGEVREQALFLIVHHMDTLTADKGSLRRKLSKYGLENLQRLIDLQQADQAGKGKTGKPEDFDKIRKVLEQLEKEEGRLQIRDLAVNGHDLMALGYTAGPELGNCQKILLDCVLRGELVNEKEVLLQKAEELLKQEGYNA